jgi:ABC-type multidrug transport system fused ATPase/permease subunit
MAGWRRSMGYVPQTIFLLDDTVRANIAFDGRDHVDDVQVHRAAQQANFHDFIEKLPGGYDFVVGERGALLSGGQRQRVGIARALYRDARILIMDEATSALDSVTEREIIDTLSALKHQKTVVMIAHRLSTIRCADHILVIDDGKLLDQGSFDDLIERSAPFRQLVAAADMDGTIRAA